MAHTSFLIQLPDKVVRDERDESRALLQQFGPSGPSASSSVLLDRLSRSLTTLVLTKLFVSGCISLLVALSASTRRQQSIECTLAAITAVVTLLSYVKIVMIRAEGSRRMQELLARGSTEATTPAAIATAASLEHVLYSTERKVQIQRQSECAITLTLLILNFHYAASEISPARDGNNDGLLFDPGVGSIFQGFFVFVGSLPTLIFDDCHGFRSSSSSRSSPSRSPSAVVYIVSVACVFVSITFFGVSIANVLRHIPSNDGFDRGDINHNNHNHTAGGDDEYDDSTRTAVTTFVFLTLAYPILLAARYGFLCDDYGRGARLKQFQTFEFLYEAVHAFFDVVLKAGFGVFVALNL
jgi:hypothetical protein